MARWLDKYTLGGVAGPPSQQVDAHVDGKQAENVSRYSNLVEAKRVDATTGNWDERGRAI